jgi:hypothetical protein
MTACRRRFCPLPRNRFVLVSGSTSHLERIIQVANDDLAGWERIVRQIGVYRDLQLLPRSGHRFHYEVQGLPDRAYR